MVAEETLEELAMQYALTVPVNPGWDGNMFASEAEIAAEELFAKMEKLAGPVLASAAITQARYTLKIMDAIPPDPKRESDYAFR